MKKPRQKYPGFHLISIKIIEEVVQMVKKNWGKPGERAPFFDSWFKYGLQMALDNQSDNKRVEKNG